MLRMTPAPRGESPTAHPTESWVQCRLLPERTRAWERRWRVEEDDTDWSLVLEHVPRPSQRAVSRVTLGMALCGAAGFVLIGAGTGVVRSIGLALLTLGMFFLVLLPFVGLATLARATREPILRARWRGGTGEWSPAFTVFRVSRLPLLRLGFQLRDAQGTAIASIWTPTLAPRLTWYVQPADSARLLLVRSDTSWDFKGAPARFAIPRLRFVGELPGVRTLIHWLASRAYRVLWLTEPRSPDGVPLGCLWRDEETWIWKVALAPALEPKPVDRLALLTLAALVDLRLSSAW